MEEEFKKYTEVIIRETINASCDIIFESIKLFLTLIIEKDLINTLSPEALVNIALAWCESNLEKKKGEPK